MCIIAIKKPGVAMPDDETLATLWRNNPDGAGLMYAEGGRVHIEKGYMNMADFLGRIARLRGAMDTTATPFVLHFRITTHGGTISANCHPFPITNNMAVLQKLLSTTDVGVAHNGIINIRTRSKNISDTMEYIASQLAYIKRMDKRFYENTDALEMIENAIQSKMAFLVGDGRVVTVGAFETDDESGMVYSNGSYKPRVYKWTQSAPHTYTTHKSPEPVVRKRSYKYKAIAMIDDMPDAVGAYVRDTDSGELLDRSECGVDHKGLLYRVDYETGCAYRIHGTIIGGDVKFSPSLAVNYECYDSFDDLLMGAYSTPW